MRVQLQPFVFFELPFAELFPAPFDGLRVRSPAGEAGVESVGAPRRVLLMFIASGWVGVAAPTDQKATASSLYLLFYYVGSGVVGWAGGYVWSSLRWGGVVGAVCFCLAACYGLTRLASREGGGR